VTEEWEYFEEALAYEEEREAQRRFEAMPAICQRCWWLGRYHLEGCAHSEWPRMARTEEEWCSLFARDLRPFRPRWLWLLVIRAQYGFWKLRVGYREEY
jgi:hypothetical protein